MTLSTRYFVEAGRTNPATRLIAMSTNPSASSPRRGFISAQTSGRLFHAFLRFSLLDRDLAVVSMAMIRGRKYTSAIRCLRCEDDYIGKTGWKEQLSSVSRGSRARKACPGGAVQAQNAGNEFANCDAQMSPESAFQTGVILRPAEQIAHQLPEHRAAPHELHHARGNRAPQKRSSIKTPHDARCELQFGAECSLHPSRVLLRTAFGKGAPQQFSGANRIEKAFADQRIDPRRRIADQRPIFSNDVS